MNRPLFASAPGPHADVKFALREIGREHARIFALVGKFNGLARAGAESSGLPVLLDKIIKHLSSDDSSRRSSLDCGTLIDRTGIG